MGSVGSGGGGSGGAGGKKKHKRQARTGEDAAMRHAQKSSGEAEEWVDLESTLR
jgi:hypothetical protein